MAAREWQVGLVGTFDVENYGDLLFPLIAEAELGQRLGAVRLHCFSYHAKTAEEWPFGVTSVTELPRLAADLDAFLVGGGFVVRFDKQVAPGYGPPTAEIHHPTGYWLTPALIALQNGVPLLWNAPGAHYEDIPGWADPLLELVLALSAYVAVRDEPSRAALARFAGEGRIALVPDTGFGVARLLAEGPSFEFNRLRDACGLNGPYVVIQPVRGLEGCQRFLKKHADRLRDIRFLVLPMGPVNGDDPALLDAELPGCVRLPVWPPPLLLAELIRHAAAVVGPSYHMAITALTAGVPVFSPADLERGKFPGLAGFENIYPLPQEDADPDAFRSRLGRTAVAPQVCAALERLERHWDRVAEVVVGGATDAKVALGRFWQSLPGVLEAAAQRQEAAATAAASQAALAAACASDRERIAELTQLVALARAEIVARDSRIAALLASTSWKVSAPVRFVGRRLRR